MALVQDIARFTISELGLHKVEPISTTEWNLIHSLIKEKGE